MIPIRDTIEVRHYPVVNILIISANVLIYIWLWLQGPGQERIYFLYGLVPLRYSDPFVARHFSPLEQLVPFLSSMFLHGGLFHLLSNVWFLYIFGDNVEDRLGSLRYLFFYLLSGIAAGVVHLVTNWDSQVPTIGASGAIAGVMGAYMVLYPKAKILALIPIFLFLHMVELPAYFFLGFWFFMQFFSATMSGGQAGGIAWWAHIGGFVSGIILLRAFALIPRPQEPKRPKHWSYKRSTPRLLKVDTRPQEGDLDLYGTLILSPQEARQGTKKIVNIPQGTFQKTILLTIPPGTKDGTTLRVGGLGRKGRDGKAGDLYLRVIFME